MNVERKIVRNRYSLFGLQIESDLPLPELFEAAPTGPADVRIELGTVPAGTTNGSDLHVVDGGAVLIVDKAARFFVADGSRIVIEREDGASDRNVRLFLLGSAFGLLLHQRRLLPLHANAVEIDGNVVAFMGESGAGKSTLAAWLNDRGFPLIADDVTVVQFDGAIPMIQPGLPRLRLWQAVVEATGRDPAAYPLSADGEPDLEKRDVMLPRTKVASGARRLGALVELGRSGGLIEPVRGAVAAEAVMAHTYRGRFIRAVQSVAEHWALCMRLVQAVPVFRTCVDFDLKHLDRSYEPLLNEERTILATRGR